MHIKQIFIQGFKSYKDRTEVEPFSPKHNVIVGRNGSGKSNFFAAIRFVLGDQYQGMSREERQALLHEGAGSAVMSAYVELVFDNSDERFPTGGDEVVLRRTIGQKKDEYSLNRKNSTKSEVMSLLESAGFSKSNPYYIVPQGRITAITNMKDPERLLMLKEVAGTKVYEDRRAESVRIMDESKNKRGKIDDLLDHIRERLGELEEEKNELREFQEKDRERRCLEYTIHKKEQEALEDALSTLEQDRDRGLETSDENREVLAEREQELEAVEAEIADLQQQLKVLTEEKLQLEEDRRDSAKDKASAEYDVQAMADGQNAAQQARTQAAQELRQVQQQVAAHETELAGLLPQYEAASAAEQAAKQQMHDAEALRARLYAKQGRNQRYRNKKERDADLTRQINEINVQLATRKAVSMQISDDLEEMEGQIAQFEQDITTLRDRLQNRGSDQETISNELQTAKDEKERLNDRRKEVWREEARLDSVLTHAQQELDKSERFLAQMMDQSAARGLASVRRIIRQHNIQGTHGCLGELFEFPDKYKTAIEITAGTSLFHFVVDSDDIATRIVDILQRERGGRCTFMPLNRLKPRPANIPKASDAVPLLSKLRYDATYEKAFQQVFGKTIVCPTLQVASQYARSHGVSAITPDGDRSDKKGALTGGYHDVRNSRLVAIKRTAAAQEEFDSHASQKSALQKERETLDQQVTKALSDLQHIEQRRQQMEGGYGPLRDELRRKEQELGLRKDDVASKQRQRLNVQSHERDQSQQLTDYQNELNSAFQKALSNAEEQQLEQASSQLPTLREQVADLSSQRSDLEARKTTIELELRENLRLRLDQLQDQDADAGASSDGTGNAAQINERRKDLKRLTKSLAAVNAKLAENETAIEAAQQQLKISETSRAEKQQQVEELQRSIQNYQKTMQKAAHKRGAVQERLTDVTSSIRSLGALPEAAFAATYTTMSSHTATTRLHKVKEALKKYGHVNKNAFEQFAQFERQREVLEERRTELDSSDGSIRTLIEVLDTRKDEAIERTFRQVSKEFARIFERLVPAGKGRLIIQRRSDRATANGNGNESDEEEAAGTVENYTGVGVSVSFNSKHDEQQRIQQLSGGQKSLCALTLIFAIQASDPAPFYLFDEVDANLDAQYRTAVAGLIQESAAGGQFICTTFRPEMLRVADKCYGVSQQRKASNISVVGVDDALDFVEGQVGGAGK
ncbi:Structural maintenance of chromosomes protein 3 [Oleoguttula sp. CCFEE 5521]